MTKHAAIHRRDGALHVEGVSAASLVASHGTPLFVYSRAALMSAWDAWMAGIAASNRGVNGPEVKVHVAVKANSNLGVLSVFARLGAGFDIVSGGELRRVLAAGGKAADVVFSGVGKSVEEIREALVAGVKCFNVESIPELSRLDDIAGSLGMKAPVALRINPDVDANTHAYNTTGKKGNKFGIDYGDAREAYAAAASMAHLDVCGVDCHIGSGITDTAPFIAAVDRVLDLVDILESNGIPIAHIDLGGGLGIDYGDGATPPPTPEFVKTILDHVDKRGPRPVWFEPGRSLTAAAGLLLSKVEYLKPGPAGGKNFCIIDAAMNDLARPTVYGAFHRIEAVEERVGDTEVYDVVGPVCESGDWLGRARELNVKVGDLLAVRDTGAYSFVMSSNYNTRPRAAEIIVDGESVHVVRKRETVEQLLSMETVLP
ncbi:diaminopimelate decarboxylase [Cutaneotrichosporon oleaginosum]|uniref:Diaminopimelate decarboxylase n=1 Tax=Cutaneotrichosporon oleaginosum TaxID=879819 RepID=A0A0J0XIJ8_9TREE|nr:diaminopimelate decarboxylase [Cutaneotrichosporon oleaginosum]KLT40901.1 diaminopimelate decarboxylase [Cutaneotrichosporon oleaginosum]